MKLSGKYQNPSRIYLVFTITLYAVHLYILKNSAMPPKECVLNTEVVKCVRLLLTFEEDTLCKKNIIFDYY